METVKITLNGRQQNPALTLRWLGHLGVSVVLYDPRKKEYYGSVERADHLERLPQIKEVERL